MRGDVKWTNLSRREIAGRMGALGTPVSRDVVSQLLRQHGYRRRKALKKKTMGHHRDRNAQFEKIARLFGCDPKTIRQGQAELEGTDDLDTRRVRKKGVDGNGGSSSSRPSPRAS